MRSLSGSGSAPREFGLRVSVDLFKCSISIYPEQFITLLKEADYKCVKDRIAKGKYECGAVFKSDDLKSRLTIFYKPRRGYHYPPPAMITLDDPNKEAIELLHSLFRYCHMKPKLSYVEIAFDFFTNDLSGLEDWLRAHVFLKHQRQEAMRQEETSYTTNLYKSVKGTRQYKKNIGNNGFLRFEPVLKRPILRKKGIEFPALNVESLDFSVFFDFRNFNRGRFYEHDYKKHANHTGGQKESDDDV